GNRYVRPTATAPHLDSTSRMKFTLPAADPDDQRIQRVVLAASRSEPVREAEEVFLVDRTQHRCRGSLDDLVFQRLRVRILRSLQPRSLARLRVRQAKLARSSRCKSGPGKGWPPPGSECCVGGGDTAGEAYTAIECGKLSSRESGTLQ